MVKEVIEKNKELFDKYRYPIKIVELQEKLKRGGFNSQSNIIKGEIKAPSKDDIRSLPEKGSDEYNELNNIGISSIKNNEVGIVILNGGMATRFGGGVKGLVEVFDGKSFLQLKIENAKAIAEKNNAKVPVFIMNSFQSEKLTEDFLIKHNNFGYEHINSFNQLISVRLDVKGEVFLDENGYPSFYAPGHGDFRYAFVNSGMLDKFMQEGGKYLLFSNGDNLAATLDPAIIGLHIRNGNEMTIEVAEKDPGDKGGAPAFVDGKLQIVENFKFPADFDQSTIPVMNTNSFVFSAESLKKEIELDWYVALKDVKGRKVVQFERLANEMSIHLMTGFVVVPKEGPDGRFIPIKLKEYLDKYKDVLKEMLEKRNNE
jgi:UTP--glucose-1-phosphate uridylyltransferase